jgi:phenylacetate-CoA ligase
MLIIRGVNVFPTQIEELVLQQDKLSGQYQIVVTREGPLDNVEVRCELQQAVAHISNEAVEEVSMALCQRIKNMVGITTQVTVLRPESIERTLTGKARRVIDKRPR